MGVHLSYHSQQTCDNFCGSWGEFVNGTIFDCVLKAAVLQRKPQYICFEICLKLCKELWSDENMINYFLANMQNAKCGGKQLLDISFDMSFSQWKMTLYCGEAFLITKDGKV